MYSVSSLFLATGSSKMDTHVLPEMHDSLRRIIKSRLMDLEPFEEA